MFALGRDRWAVYQKLKLIWCSQRPIKKRFVSTWWLQKYGQFTTWWIARGALHALLSHLYRKLLTYAPVDQQPPLGRTRDQLSEVRI